MLTETGTLITRVGELIQSLITIVGALALLVFMWGLVKFIFSQGNETAKTEGKKVMVWGLIALFVMVSVWGIIGFIQSDLGLPVTTDGSNNSNQGVQQIDSPPNYPNSNTNPFQVNDDSVNL